MRGVVIRAAFTEAARLALVALFQAEAFRSGAGQRSGGRSQDRVAVDATLQTDEALLAPS